MANLTDLGATFTKTKYYSASDPTISVGSVKDLHTNSTSGEIFCCTKSAPDAWWQGSLGTVIQGGGYPALATAQYNFVPFSNNTYYVDALGGSTLSASNTAVTNTEIGAMTVNRTQDCANGSFDFTGVRAFRGDWGINDNWSLAIRFLVASIDADFHTLLHRVRATTFSGGSSLSVEKNLTSISITYATADTTDNTYTFTFDTPLALSTVYSVVLSKTSNQLSCYLDGNLVGSPQTITTYPNGHNYSPLFVVGGHRDRVDAGAANYAPASLDGKVYDLGFWNRPLSATEAQDFHYIQPLTSNYPSRVLEYTMDSVTGSTLNDTAGSVNAILVNTPTLSVGTIGSSLKFVSPSSQYAYANADFAALMGQEYSISLWVKKNTEFTLGRYFSITSNTLSNDNNIISLRQYTGINGQFHFADNNGTNVFAEVTITQAEGWVHLLLTRSQHSIRIFKNGVKVADTVGILLTTGDQLGVLALANRYEDSTNSFASDYADCEIDQFRVFNETLGEREAKALYNE